MASDPSVVSRDALVTTSLEGRVVAWSKGAQALFGWRENEVVGRGFADLVHQKHHSVDAQSVAEVAAGHCVRDTIVKHVRSDGAVLSCLQTMVPLRDAMGRVTAVLRIIFDLSSIHEAERALRRALAQVNDVATAPVEPFGRGAVSIERERTRAEYLRAMAGEARRLIALLDPLAVGSAVPADARAEQE